MKIISEQEVQNGQSVYTPLTLTIYDLWVIQFSNRWIWRCPKHIQLKQFQDLITNNHLDIGVGTGYYLRECQWAKDAKVSLMDLNPTCLETAKAAIATIPTQTYAVDIFKPQDHLSQHFDSISMNFLLHCLPGDMDNKSVVIENAAHMLKPNGVLFGATILSDASFQTPFSNALAAFYNKKGIFSNTNDTYESLNSALERHLKDVKVRVFGSVALFQGKV